MSGSRREQLHTKSTSGQQSHKDDSTSKNVATVCANLPQRAMLLPHSGDAVPLSNFDQFIDALHASVAQRNPAALSQTQLAFNPSRSGNRSHQLADSHRRVEAKPSQSQTQLRNSKVVKEVRDSVTKKRPGPPRKSECRQLLFM
jgi:hypothetical protein